MSKPEPLLECHRCGAGYDVAGLKPDTRFKCENCNAWLRVPRPKSRVPLVAAACGIGAIVVVALVYVLGTGGGSRAPEGPADQARRPAEPPIATPADTPPEKPPEKPPEREVDLVALEYEAVAERAKSGRIPDLLALARFCGKHERYAAEAEKAYRAILALDREHEAALNALGLACMEGLLVPRDWYDAVVKSAWYTNAVALLNREIKSKQDLCDLGLSYAYAPPFVLVRERSPEETGDRVARRKAAAILRGLGPAFNELLGKDLGVDATAIEEVVPVFWFRSKQAQEAYWESRRPDLLEMERGETERNPYWCLCNEENITRLTLSPLAAEAAENLARAVTARKGALPDWVVLGIGGLLGRVHYRVVRGDVPEVRYQVDDRPTLRALARAEDRPTITNVVNRKSEAKKLTEQLLEELKKQGIDPDSIGVDITGFEGWVAPRAAWGLTAFLLHGDPARRTRFIDFLKRMRDGEDEVKAFHAAFKEKDGEEKIDLEALDRAWVEWLKAEAGKN